MLQKSVGAPKDKASLDKTLHNVDLLINIKGIIAHPFYRKARIVTAKYGEHLLWQLLFP